ncbi:MAG: hypothetical protein GY705_00835 [Bacteroidetes bacterium]|nr:hypothetical protein [Bacteroidota bacterium]
MKKMSTRFFIVLFIIIASICSYIYLNTVSVDKLESSVGKQPMLVEEKDNSDSEEQKNQICLPDVRMVKKVVEAGKRFLPAS